ncbi:MAG: phage holin family protein [Solirubrobacterales bacterium]
MAATTDSNSQASIVAAINEVSDKAQLLVREEIELAKAEVTEKLTKLAKGAAVGLAAGIFVITGLLFLLHGLAWLAYWVIPFPDGTFFWGFFVVAGILFLVGGLAGFLAARWLKKGSSPAPHMAIEEAKLIRETVKSSDPETTI